MHLLREGANSRAGHAQSQHLRRQAAHLHCLRSQVQDQGEDSKMTNELEKMEPGFAKEALLHKLATDTTSETDRPSPTCPHCGESLYSRMMRFAGLEFHTAEHLTVVIRTVPDRQLLDFTSSEATLLAVLAHAKGRLVTKERLYDAMYWRRAGDGPDAKVIDVVVCKIRKKLLKYNIPAVVNTMWGRGYQLELV